MQSAKHPAPISLCLTISTALLVSGCVTGRPTVAFPSAPCSTLVPDSLRKDVPGVALPGLSANAGDVWVAFDGQTQRLDVSNANKTAALEIVSNCEKRDAAAVRHVTRRFWEFWK